MNSGQKQYYQLKLHQELADRCQRNPKYSLRAFAKLLKITPGFLSSVINGRKTLSVEYAEKFVRELELQEMEALEFIHSALAVQKNKKNLSPAPMKLDNAIFDRIDEWYYYTILSLVKLEASSDDPKWFAKQLGISLHESTVALEKLVHLGFLKQEGGKFVRCLESITTKNSNQTTDALKKRQRQIREKAIQAIDEIPIELRSMSSITMCIDSRRIQDAKDRIAKFQEDMSEFLTGKQNDKVYAMEISLFPLQKL